MIRYLSLVTAVIAAVALAGPATGASDAPADEAGKKPPVTANPDDRKTDSVAAEDSTAAAPTFVAYYFHGTRRCSNCRKIEAYSAEAIQAGFADELKDGRLEWRVVNIDESENRHYIQDYQLYTKSVVLSSMTGGKEIKWINLDKIWQLLGDKEKFIDYVQEETRAFMGES